tara:strand:- start:125 stop:367 length:243 start_codon:yes stop_codon:yes gene_type:complete
MRRRDFLKTLAAACVAAVAPTPLIGSRAVYDSVQRRWNGRMWVGVDHGESKDFAAKIWGYWSHGGVILRDPADYIVVNDV